VTLIKRYKLSILNVSERDIDHVSLNERSVIFTLKKRTRFDFATFSLYLVLKL